MNTDTLLNHPTLPAVVPTDRAPLRVALIGCGKSKLPYPAPARDLYTGSLFRAARAWARTAMHSGEIDAWWILSARHGLLHPDMIVGPYEATIGALNLDGINRWTAKVDAAFRSGQPGYGQWTQHGGRLEVAIYAGAAYANPLLARWAPLSWTVRAPHAGLQIGERIAAFTWATNAAGGARPGPGPSYGGAA